jgi:hypothetical protein
MRARLATGSGSTIELGASMNLPDGNDMKPGSGRGGEKSVHTTGSMQLNATADAGGKGDGDDSRADEACRASLATLVDTDTGGLPVAGTSPQAPKRSAAASTRPDAVTRHRASIVIGNPSA